ncbi:MFS transporter [Candidatus Saccharibacteria bacterium]|nr:MFS transporter [Candidatus Saccharibacteria bacterium]
MRDRAKFNMFLFISTFARALIEVFISLFLFKNGFPISSVLLFYLLENMFALFISYGFVRLGEKYGYLVVMCLGVISFVVLQFVLNNVMRNSAYIVLIALLYSFYRRGYWVARRYYVTEVMPQQNSSGPFSIMMVVSELASISAGFLGSFLLDGFNALVLTILSSVLLFISVIPLLKIKKKTNKTKIELIKNFKKYDKRNYLAFSLYEINNLLAFIFPIFIAIYIGDTYMMAGTVNAISCLAIIIFILIYGKIIKKRNYFVISSVLFILVSLTKLLPLGYFILILCFAEGLIKKMQEQSVNKIYFENRNNMDLTHYNLIYQIIEAIARAVVVIPLLFMNDIRVMIAFVLIIISAEVAIYACMKKDRKLN